ncbi:UvrD-helicase domain-containing protein [Sphingobacterium sp. DN00404]|uniref:DNA 3'-5' helicase n=1 Tax=Sphingobacterium micropteri TaxID=2763501 RepID=A0ABR7YJV9_9SPHI|nr:UvrD-helicase domain-containing protein [Sphingobacterium micropteri]MBD1431603.1 UvrD-helicase domain-containing protein [Sphingobacterium micropteri]
MDYFVDKSITKQVVELRKRGGIYQKAAEKVKQIIGDISLKQTNPFSGISITKHGETRIKNCIKYDLSGFVRLITIQEKSICTLKFVGTHDECDKWLESNKGLNIAVNSSTKTMVDVMISEDIHDVSKRLTEESDYSEGILIERLKENYLSILTDSVLYKYVAPFQKFDSTVSHDELLDACLAIPDDRKQTLYFDVFSSLLKGDLDAAKNRLLEFKEEIKLIDVASNGEISEITSNDQYLKLSDIDPDIFEIILSKTDWYEWMVFLHPEQKKVVETNYNGPARLLGVSGSGKTCVLIHRAIRLAKQYPGEKVLILTLNKSLANLIRGLVYHLLEQSNSLQVFDHIKISSFWELSRDLLEQFDDKNPLFQKTYNLTTYKTNESIDEIWQEYYRCEANNSDAEVIFPIHQTLLSRGIYPEDYIKQEFDWIRSALQSSSRVDYLKIERGGRYIPLQEDDRKLILKGLEGWERKMEDVGAIDHLGFTSALVNYLEQIKPIYRSVLVDEIQDFGTLELKVIRRLASEAVNDIFVCGDTAQQVYNKHHKIRSAGINILPEGFVKILKNYRNSREILEAAYNLFKNNVNIEQLKNDEMEILNPEYANFSSPKPFLRKGLSIQHEVNSSIQYLKMVLDREKKEKACIALCGYTIFEISSMFKNSDLVVLDGERDLSESNIFISDLEQTKGFEFDRMIIINCTKQVFPNPDLPKEESYRDISKLYVAMTRAKKDLIISYSRDFSEIFTTDNQDFTYDNWSDHLEDKTDVYQVSVNKYSAPTKLDLSKLTGKDFLYHKKSVGISRELQNKLQELVDGKDITDDKGKKIGWKNMALLSNEINSRTKDIPSLSRTFGPSVYKEVEILFV